MKRSTPWGGKAREHWDCSQEPLQLRIRLACKISTNSQRLMSTPEDQPNTQGRRWLASGGGLKKPEYLYAAISSAKVGSSFSVPPLLDMITPIYNPVCPWPQGLQKCRTFGAFFTPISEVRQALLDTHITWMVWIWHPYPCLDWLFYCHPLQGGESPQLFGLPSSTTCSTWPIMHLVKVAQNHPF